MNEPDSESDYAGRILVGKYQLDEPIGSGGMGTVWSATHLEIGSRLAIKLIRPEFAEKKEARQRFEIEARAAAQVDSPHAVAMYDHGVTEDGVPFLVMEYLEGESLADSIVRRGVIPLDELVEIVAQAGRALEKAHARGIVHRDLKPDNFFLATNVQHARVFTPYVVKLVDFGIAKLLDIDGRVGGFGLSAGPTQTGMVIGTPTFMSPEQLTEGRTPDALMDIWALGVTTFTAAVGHLPFEGEMLGDIVLKVCAQPMPIPSTENPLLPDSFDRWFESACARDRSQRYQTIRELVEGLRIAAAGPVRRRVALGGDQSPAAFHDTMRAPAGRAAPVNRSTRGAGYDVGPHDAHQIESPYLQPLRPVHHAPIATGLPAAGWPSAEQTPTRTGCAADHQSERRPNNHLPFATDGAYIPSAYPGRAGGLTPKMALILGLVLGLSMLLAIVGLLAYRNKVAEETLQPSPATSR